MTSYLAIRVRGSVNVRTTIADTLSMLRLHRVNHAVLVPDDPSHKGMLQKAKDYVTYGEADAPTLAKLIATRLKLVGEKPVTDEYVAEHTSFGSIAEFAAALAEGRASLKDLPDVKPVFRLSPPRGGHGGIKRSVQNGGALGYRGADVNALAMNML